MADSQAGRSVWLVHMTFRLAFCALSVSLLNCSMCTFNTSVLNIPFKVVRRRMNATLCARGECAPPDWDFLPLTTSIYVAAGACGSFASGYLADRLGRLRAMWFDQPVVLVGAVLSGCAYWVPELIHVGRVLLGFGCAVSFCVAATYLTEISPRRIRGIIGCCNQLGVVLGVLVAQLLGLPQLLGTEELWPFLVAFPALPALLSLVLLRWCPESARYLFMTKQDEEGARKALVKLRKTAEQVDDDLREYRCESAQGQSRQFGVLQLFTEPTFRMPLALALGICLTQQLSGISAIFVYSSSIFETAGLPASQMPLAVLATGLVNLLFTILSILLIDKCGRRALLIWPTCLMAAASLAIIFSIRYQNEVHWLSYVSIACVILFIVGYTPGLGPIASLLPTELFRQEARSAATALSQGVLWGACLLVHLTFKPVMQRVGELIFIAFLLLLVSSIVFFYIYLPETKNKTFEEIQVEIRKRKFCTRKPDGAENEKTLQLSLVNAAC